MRALKVVREAGVRWVIAQGGLEPVSRCPPLRNEPANGYPVTRDDDGLAMLDCIEDVGEAPCRLRGSHYDHEYILSDLVCLCVYKWRGLLCAEVRLRATNARLREVLGAKDAEIGVLQAGLDAARERERRLELRLAELQRRLGMYSSPAGSSPARRARGDAPRPPAPPARKSQGSLEW
jgi:hypothetical protein